MFLDTNVHEASATPAGACDLLDCCCNRRLGAITGLIRSGEVKQLLLRGCKEDDDLEQYT